MEDGNLSFMLNSGWNASCNSSEQTWLDENDYIFDKPYVQFIFLGLYSLVFCFCFFGNLAVVLVVTLHCRMRSITKFCLGNLAFANLCVGIFCVYQNLSTYLMERWIFGTFMCKMYHFINSLSHTASVLILVVMCVERYLAILKPLKFRRMLTITKLRILIITVWFLSAILSSPRLYYITTYSIPSASLEGEERETVEICAPQRNLYDTHTADMIYFIVLFIFPISVMTILYTRMGIYLWHSAVSARVPSLSYSPSLTSVRSSVDISKFGSSYKTSGKPYKMKLKRNYSKNLRSAPSSPTSIENPHVSAQERDIPYNSPILRRCKSERAPVSKDGIQEVAQVGAKIRGTNIQTEHMNEKIFTHNESLSTLNIQDSLERKFGEENSMILPDEAPISDNLIPNKQCSSNINSAEERHVKAGVTSRENITKSSRASKSSKSSPKTGNSGYVSGNLRAPCISKNIFKSRRSVVRMLIVIVITFALCNLPFHMRKICQNYVPNYNFSSHFSNLLTPLTFLLMYTNCAINPILYAFMSKSFRASFVDLIRCKLH